jgi:hypothetical protein
MKRYRKWQLFSRQRRQEKCFLLILGLISTFLFGSSHFNQVINSNNITTTGLSVFTPLLPLPNCHCSKSSLVVINHGECFFDRLVCYPGFIGDQCEIQLKNEVGGKVLEKFVKLNSLISDLSSSLSIRYSSNSMDTFINQRNENRMFKI